MPRLSVRKSLAQLLGLKYSLIQAPMAGSQDSELCIAVSKAGGLGSLPCAMLSINQAQESLTQIKNAGIEQFNLNFFAHTMPPVEEKLLANWSDVLKPYWQAYGLEVDQIKWAAGRQPFTDEWMDLIVLHRPSVVSFHFGLPSKTQLKHIQGLGCRVASSATTLKEGQWLQAQGVDFVIAQGLEAGGHRGHFLSHDLSVQLGLFSLLPQLVSHLDCPVVAAGGIATPSAVHAAEILGAAGVQVGTAYLLCPEAKTSAVHRQALKNSASTHTALTNLFSGRPARGLVNRLMMELGALRDDAPPFPWAGTGLAELRARAESKGLGDFSPLWAGQSASFCQTFSAQQITSWLMEGSDT